MDDKTLRYKIGIGLIPKIGPVITKRLISHCGSIEGIFCEKRANLARIPGIGVKLIDSVLKYRNSDIPDMEIEYIRKHNITPLFYLDENYPARLKQCEDAPVMIYVKGNAPLDRARVISVVGTRSPTEYGRNFTNEFIENMAVYYPDVLIVSGLAYGIDVSAHRAALKNGMETAAVLGHGLSHIYPALHRETARQIIQKGALISEFLHDTKPESPNFVRRNRIIAGLSDATIIVESGKRGGALITADLAGSYNRDVFAVPGRITDKYSVGCNNLIKTNRAAMAENLHDIEYLLGWQRPVRSHEAIQTQMFMQLDQDETFVMDHFKEKDCMTIDQLAVCCSMPVSKVSAILINLECKGLIKCMPGKVFTALN
ncbi:MAG: DNA-processing protein DprA [Bacteroidales bacterium]|nr:DNA-processing protein DprA [Bacteroidales bacterium]